MMTEKGEDCSRKGFIRLEGFTLIELAIVIVISGFIMASLSAGITMYRKQAVLDKTDNHIDAVSLAVKQMFNEGLGGRYPRPAGRNLGPSDPDYGIEISAADAAALAIGDCTASMVCKVAGARDADGDGNVDPVLIGAVPVRTMRDMLLSFITSQYQLYEGAGLLHSFTAGIKVTESASYDFNLDGWGRAFTYAVTENLTDPATYDDLYGSIAVETEGGESLLGEPGSAHVLFVSHGPDGKGAYTPDGKLYRACNATLGNDQENCNDDSTFISGLMSLGDNAEYFDDFLRFFTRGSSTIWRPSSSVGAGIYNTNPGRVGIGTDAPTQKLHVLGDAQTGNAHANSYCDQTGGDCLIPATIGGAGINCSSGNTMTGISYNSAECGASPSAPVVLSTNCPAGEVLQGINADGSLNCAGG
ncbi:MAG: prepilin-type N-terminal cleavage/methylation domain-containing protein [Alphaproteobacteria bacterium]|nr:MAG: prepilin-type N-terminal cleavage/methylation domain-containing protein [Alphaproteobacteria bacterium]